MDELGRGAYEVTLENADTLRKITETEQAFTKAGAASDKASQVGRAGMAAFAGVAGIATKGLLDLDNVSAKFTADTGASAEAAKAAGKAINDMSGRNLQPMREIGDALGKVHTDLGLTGKAAADTAEDFLHFARVTGQDAAAEVSAFDDILDAWGLTAADSQGLMDKLVVSHQKYGGSIAANESALAGMAPQLKALNLNIDDGIGLLNLFAESGLDAAAIPRALNSAIQKLDGKPLEDFVAELAGIEDPGKRAERAIEIFGAKAGVGLANAIKPGMTSLAAFEVSALDAAGATDRAREALDGTFTNQVQLAIKGVTSRIVEFGSAFGPAVTGIASLASLGGALGLDKFAGVFTKKLLEVGKAGGTALIDGVATATGAAGTVIGNFFASRIENIVDPTKNTVLGAIVRRSGAAIGLMQGAAIAASTALAAGLATVVAAMPGVGLLRSAILASALKLGTLQGTAMGTAAGAAFSAALLVGVILAAEEAEKHLNKAAAEWNIGEKFGVDFDLHPEEWPWPLGPRDPVDWYHSAGDAEDGGKLITDGLSSGLNALTPKTMDDYAADITTRLHAGLKTGAPVVAASAHTIGLGMAQAIKESSLDMVRITRRTPLEMAQALLDQQFSVKDAIEHIGDIQEQSVRRSREIIRIEAFLTGDAMAKGLEAKDPAVRLAWQGYQQIAQARLDKLKPTAKKGGEDTGGAVAEGLGSKEGEVRTAAGQLTGAARSKFGNLEDDAYGYGANTGASYLDGLVSELRNTKSVSDAIYLVSRLFYANTPPGPESPLHFIDRWGDATGESFVSSLARGVAAGGGMVRAAVASVAGAFSLDPMASVSRAAAIAPMTSVSRGEVMVTHRIEDPNGSLAAIASSPREVAQVLAQGLDATGFLQNVRHAAATG